MVIDRYLSANLAALDPRFKAFLRPDGTLVVRLLKALYGTVEASRLWYDVITGLMLKAGCKNMRFSTTYIQSKQTPP